MDFIPDHVSSQRSEVEVHFHKFPSIPSCTDKHENSCWPGLVLLLARGIESDIFIEDTESLA